MDYPPAMQHEGVTQADVAVIGAGLAGLVAACEAAEAGGTVVVLDQEPEQSLGGQAHWSLGGIFLVDSREQRRLGVMDSLELATADWFGSAQFDRAEDHWPRRWAEAFLDFAAGEARSWLRQQGVRFFPVVGWAEGGDLPPGGHGNSVPRFHITWGTGPGVLAPFVRRASAATSTWCGRRGRRGWAARPNRWWRGCRRTSTAACSASPRRLGRA